ncbi:MAG: response regulator transcription factor [Candidatus Krumholzibacteria bacterium]|jgi:DNA-binding NarL/FixJ family response regulator|nr:response regulator transcription factor [Candidatus Krumholzibacteria bacterium]
MSTTILIADDHRLFRDGLRTLFAARKDIRVVAETTDGAETISAAAELKPDIVIMDVSMPGLNGIEAARRILSRETATRIIMLSMHSDRHFITESLKAGAMGYLLKDCPFEEVLLAVRTVREGKIYLSRQISDTVIKDYIAITRSAPASVFRALSTREREVLQLLAEGRTTKETAARLHVSVKTIETHRKQIMDKLDIHSVAELTKYAIREGLTSLE